MRNHWNKNTVITWDGPREAKKGEEEMRGSYNHFMLQQAMRCNPPLINKACDKCQSWDKAHKPEAASAHCLCRKWNVFTYPKSQCDYYSAKGV